MDTLQSSTLRSAFKLGEKPPLVLMLDESGQKVALSSFWQEKALLVAFIRHFGCPFCRAYLSQLRQHYPEFQAAEVNLLAVGMGQPDEAVAFKRSRGLPFPLLSDPHQRAYDAYGLGKFNLGQELKSGSLGAVLRQVAQGNPAGKVIGDFVQLGGTFLVDRQGVARYIHRDKTTGDFPAMPELLEAVRQLAPVSLKK